MESWEFGRMVRRRRDALAPEAAGVAVGGRRRATGLRREELAALAGISADYLTRLEQGRATAPSAQVVEALGRALRLSDPDRELLLRLAGHASPSLGLVSARIPTSVQRLLDRLAHTPVAVFDATWTLLTANAPYDAVMGATTGLQGIERNAVWRNLVRGGGRTVHDPEARGAFEAGLVADLRRTAARYPDDPRLHRLVGELSAASARFRRLWEADAPAGEGEASRRKTIEHPTVGRIVLDCDTLVVAGDDLRIMAYTAEPGTEDAERLALAVVLGTQSLVG